MVPLTYLGNLTIIFCVHFIHFLTYRPPHSIVNWMYEIDFLNHTYISRIIQIMYNILAVINIDASNALCVMHFLELKHRIMYNFHRRSDFKKTQNFVFQWF